MSILEDKAIGALCGAAVGDSLGGSTEGYSPAQIQERFGGLVQGIVGPWSDNWKTDRPNSPYHKGHGHITDDTLMTEALIEVYSQVRDHLDAFTFAEHIVPQMVENRRFIPELETETVILQRVFLAEKWLVMKLLHAHADPREAGYGHIVNCGATMYMSPVGIVNAGNPEGAYKEAIEIAGAHQSSYGREAAGVFSACVATAMTPGVTIEEVVSNAIAFAHDGTREAIKAVTAEAKKVESWDTSFTQLRSVMAPFDSLGEVYRQPGADARKPSRLKAIEELPLALAYLIISKGNYRDGVLGAVNYGRDSDSIATMFGSLCGAMNGFDAIPTEWIEAVEGASRIDLKANGKRIAAIAREVAARDAQRAQKVMANQSVLFA
jgi:ADP-ribosylglycohydrolase